MHLSLRSLALCVAFSALASSATDRYPPGRRPPWNARQFRSLLVFGDSYSDETRLQYFLDHDMNPPPTGTLLPETFDGADGGRVWPRYIVQYTQQRTQLYNYAVSGAVCSNEITPRTLAPGFDFPDVDGYELPAFLADKAYGKNVETNKPYFSTRLSASNAVYAIYIGTNDLSNTAFLLDQESRGYNLADYMDCVWNQVSRLYQSGARYFVIMNLTPLQLSPLYANDTLHGVGKNHYWLNKPANHTWISEKMRQYTSTLNALYDYRTPYEALVGGKYPGAEFALFDAGSIFSDIYANPQQYLNGTAPLNVSGFNDHCNLDASICKRRPSPDSYLWHDELHPSEQTERVIAREFLKVMDGTSQRTKYYSGR